MKCTIRAPTLAKKYLVDVGVICALEEVVGENWQRCERSRRRCREVISIPNDLSCSIADDPSSDSDGKQPKPSMAVIAAAIIGPNPRMHH